VEVGTLVELLIRGKPVYGVVKWIGFLPPPDHQVKMAGIEMVSNVRHLAFYSLFLLRVAFHDKSSWISKMGFSLCFPPVIYGSL